MGAKRLSAFRRGWNRVLIRDRGPETQDTLRVEKRGKTGINERTKGFLPAAALGQTSRGRNRSVPEATARAGFTIHLRTVALVDCQWAGSRPTVEMPGLLPRQPIRT